MFKNSHSMANKQLLLQKIHTHEKKVSKCVICKINTVIEILHYMDSYMLQNVL